MSLPPDRQPQPDITLLRAEFWRGTGIPTAADVLLIAEVTDTTLARHRDFKIPLYARHGIPEAWLFDIGGEAATVYRDPGPEGYRTAHSPARGASLSPLLRPEVTISLAEIWPRTAV